MELKQSEAVALSEQIINLGAKVGMWIRVSTKDEPEATPENEAWAKDNLAVAIITLETVLAKVKKDLT